MESASDDFLTLPAWFGAEQAAAVLRSKGKRLALIAGADGMTSVADLDRLAAAPGTKSVSWCATPLGPAVLPTTSLDEVRRLMDVHGTAYLPVVTAGVIVSILARDSIDAAATSAALERLAA